MRPMGTVDGAVKDMVRPVKWVEVLVVEVMREVGRLSFGGVLGREFGRLTMLAVDERGRLLGRFGRWRTCDVGPKRAFGGGENSTLLRQRMVMVGLQVLEICSVDSNMISRRPTASSEADGSGSGFSTRFAVGRTLYRKVIVSLERHVIGNSIGLRSSILPSEARETLAWFSKTLNVAKRVTSKSRQAIVVGRGELVVIREHRIRADTAGLTGIHFVG